MQAPLFQLVCEELGAVDGIIPPHSTLLIDDVSLLVDLGMQSAMVMVFLRKCTFFFHFSFVLFSSSFFFFSFDSCGDYGKSSAGYYCAYLSAPVWHMLPHRPSAHAQPRSIYHALAPGDGE